MRIAMMVKRVISILVLTVWVVTQTSMLFAHPVSVGHGTQTPTLAASHDHVHSHAGHEMDKSGLANGIHDDGNTSHPDMSGMECCGSTCTIDAQILMCPLGSDGVVRLFNGTKVTALTSTELGSPNPPPNTTF